MLETKAERKMSLSKETADAAGEGTPRKSFSSKYRMERTASGGLPVMETSLE